MDPFDFFWNSDYFKAYLELGKKDYHSDWAKSQEEKLRADFSEFFGPESISQKSIRVKIN